MATTCAGGVLETAPDRKSTSSALAEELDALSVQMHHERWRHARFIQNESTEYERLARGLETKMVQDRERIERRYRDELAQLERAHADIVSRDLIDHVNAMSRLESAYAAHLKQLRDDVECKLEVCVRNETRLVAVHVADRVDLNVGGQRFSVARDVLCRYEDSFFGVMFSGRWELKVGADGSYFVDRNPKMFAYILDWMRGEPLDLELSPAKHRALLRDAEFYQLSGLVKALQPRVWTLAETPHGTMSDDGLTLAHAGSLLDDWCVTRGTHGLPVGVHEWRVTLVRGTNRVAVGVTRDADVQRSSIDVDNVAWLCLHTGRAHAMGRREGACLPRALAVGATIIVRLDCDAGTLDFRLAGESPGDPTIDGLPRATWYPFVALCDEGTAITITH